MGGRFTTIYTMDGMRYLEGGPLLLAAGALLRDEYSGQLLCQLRMHSLSDAPIKAVTVAIQMLDTAGQPLGKLRKHRYLDLSLQRGDEFGQKTAIVLSGKEARAFTATVTELLYEDNSSWEAEPDAEWETLPPQESLEGAYEGRELADQFRIRYGADCRDKPLDAGPLWYCTCGAINHSEEASCHRCRRVRAALLDVNTDALRQEAASRARQEEDRQVEDLAETRQKRRRWLKLAALILPFVILGMGLLHTVPGMVQRRQAYQIATDLLAMGKYEQAEQAFRELGDYRDSAEQAEKNVAYQQAIHIYSRADEDDASLLSQVGKSRADLSEDITAGMLLYEGAIARFEALDGYKDSEEYIKSCQIGIEQARQKLLQQRYDEAMALLESGDYSLARQSFLELGDFSDSADMAKEAVYRKAVALYHFIEKYDVREIFADLSVRPDRGSVISMPKSVAFGQGSHCVDELRAACGNDLVDVSFAEEPTQGLRPLAVCVTELFDELDSYADSVNCIAGILEATDYTKDFYTLCEAGDVYGAYEWLASYEGEFADRESWLSMLELYKPYCAEWTLYGGDPTAIPFSVGRDSSCESFRTRVIVNREQAILRLSANDGEEYFLDFTTQTGQTDFANYDGELYNQLISYNDISQHLSFMLYYKNGKYFSSCEYNLVW